jgi:hypothetical protein
MAKSLKRKALYVIPLVLLILAVSPLAVKRVRDRLGAVVDMKKGTPVDINMLKGFTTWGYAKGAFREWAELLRESLDYEEKKGK